MFVIFFSHTNFVILNKMKQSEVKMLFNGEKKVEIRKISEKN